MQLIIGTRMPSEREKKMSEKKEHATHESGKILEMNQRSKPKIGKISFRILLLLTMIPSSLKLQSYVVVNGNVRSIRTSAIQQTGKCLNGQSSCRYSFGVCVFVWEIHSIGTLATNSKGLYIFVIDDFMIKHQICPSQKWCWKFKMPDNRQSIWKWCHRNMVWK